MAKTLGEIKVPKAIPVLKSLGTGRGTNEPALQRVALQALANFDDDSIATTLSMAEVATMSSPMMQIIFFILFCKSIYYVSCNLVYMLDILAGWYCQFT